MPLLSRFLAPLLCLAIVGAAVPAPAAGPRPSPRVPAPGAESASALEPPVLFEPNVGQADPAATFVGRAGTDRVFLATDGIALAAEKAPGLDVPELARVHFVGARSVAVRGEQPLHASSHFLVGDASSIAHTDVSAFGAVRYESVYPGVDVLVYGADGKLEYDFIVAPGADPDAIAVRLEGATTPSIDRNGDLVIRSGSDEFRHTAPLVYQLVAGERRFVSGQYARRPDGAFAVALGAYDPALPLVIDPVLSYASYLGGSGDDIANGVRVGADGSVYLVGRTTSSDFPVFAARQATRKGDFDVFVTKLAPDGSSIVYSTYLGGSGYDNATAVAVDSGGNAIVVGSTTSSDFPVASPDQPTSAGQSEAFVAKLSPTGASLVYSTYLGGSASDAAYNVALDRDGWAYVVGETASQNFPAYNGPTLSFRGGATDAFLTVLDENGLGLVSTFIGGNGSDLASAIAFTPAEDAVFVAGSSNSTNLQVPPGSNGGEAGGFLAKFSTGAPAKDGASKSFSLVLIFLVLLLAQIGLDLILSAICEMSIVGTALVGILLFMLVTLISQVSRTDEFTTKADNADVAALVIDPSTGAVTQTKVFGGSGDEIAQGLVVDEEGALYVTGSTRSTDLPTVEALQAEHGGGAWDAFVVKLAPETRDVELASYLGGSGDDFGQAIAFDGDGSIYVVGGTASPDFPVTDGAAQSTAGGALDAFVAKLPSAVSTEPDFAVSFESDALTLARKQSANVLLRIHRVNGFDGEITITAPNTSSAKVKVTPPTNGTTGDSVTFKVKAKKKAVAGTHAFTFTARGADGRTRTATLTLTIQ